MQCLRSRNKIISYYATVVIRAALKLAVQPGSSDVAISSKVRILHMTLELSLKSLNKSCSGREFCATFDNL